MWKRDFFVSALSESYGKQKAEKVFEDLVKGANLPSLPEYNKEDALKICNTMKGSPELFLQILAGCLKIKLGLLKSSSSPG